MSKLLKRRSSSLITEVFFGGSNGGGGGGASVLNDLLDVTVPAPVDQDILVYNAAQGYWENKPLDSFIVHPAPPEKSVQYNKNNQFAGSSLFNYDDSNSYVGIGIETPAVNLHVKGVGQNWSGLLMDGADYASIRMKTGTGDFMWTSLPGGKFSLYEWSTNKYLFTVNTHAQMKFGGFYNNSSLEDSATFEVADSGTYPGEPHRGALPAPRMAAADRNSITSPACGLVVFNTDDNAYNVFQCNTNTWETLLDSAGLTDGKVLYSKNNTIAEDPVFLYDDQDKRLKTEKLNVGISIPTPEDTNIYLKGDGQNPMKFFNDLGVSSDGLKLIALFSRHEPAPGNAGFYAAYYVQGGDVSHTVLFAPGARDFGLTTYAGGDGAENPTIFMKDSSRFVGIGTKVPDTKLHVLSEGTRIATFSTTQQYGGIDVIVPNITAGRRANITLGVSANSQNSGNVAYLHGNSSEKAVEVYVGTTPPANMPMLRVLEDETHLQADNILWATHQEIPVGHWQLFSIQNNTYNSGRPKRIRIGAKTRDSFGRLDLTLAVSSTPGATDAHPEGDSVFYVNGSTKEIGIQNTNPQTTLDIYGAYRAIAKEAPHGEKWSRFTNMYWDRDFIKLGRTYIPEMFRHVFEQQPDLREIISFVDMDSWSLSAQSMPDFGSYNLEWTSSSPTPGTILAARFSWGKAIRYRTSQSKRFVKTTIKNLEEKTAYIIFLSLYHFYSSGTDVHSVMSILPDNSDKIRVYYRNNRLYLENTSSGQSTSITYFSSGNKAVIALLLTQDNVTAYASRWSSGNNYVLRNTLSNTAFPGSTPNSTDIVIGQENEAESPMNMDIHAFAMLAVNTKFAEEYTYRMVKRFAKLLI